MRGKTDEKIFSIEFYLMKFSQRTPTIQNEIMFGRKGRKVAHATVHLETTLGLVIWYGTGGRKFFYRLETRPSPFRNAKTMTSWSPFPKHHVPRVFCCWWVGGYRTLLIFHNLYLHSERVTDMSPQLVVLRLRGIPPLYHPSLYYYILIL